jgi:hypothetical protein
MQIGRRVPVRAGSWCVAGDPNQTLFTATLAQNAGLLGRIALPAALGAGTSQLIIRDIQVASVDANIWEFWFWGNSLGPTGDARERFMGTYAFAAAGLQIGGAGNAHASASGVDLFYEDEDAMTLTPPAAGIADPTWRATTNGQTGAYLNVSLINRSAGAKTASGFFGACFVCEATEGW